jgi:uncharacterized protein YjiS (DUF1127 family)
MKNHNVFYILTFADHKFFPVLWQHVKQVRRFVSYRLHVYDLGLSEIQKQQLTDIGITVLRTQVPADALDKNSRGHVRTTHKMYCIEDFIRTHSGPVLVLDADTLLIENIDELWPDEPDCIVVTARCPRERDASHVLVNGRINAGVMAFGSSVPAAFFRQWKERCLQDTNATDQSALSDMLAEENIDFEKFDVRQPCWWGGVVVRDGEVYNDITNRTGKIFHSKNDLIRRPKKLFLFKIFSTFLAAFPSLVEALVRYNRKHRLYV